MGEREMTDTELREILKHKYNTPIDGVDCIQMCHMQLVINTLRECDKSLRFELGKTYKHTSGDTMTIIGSLKTHIYGWAFIAELPDGTLKPVGYTDDGYAQNWSEEK